MSYDSSSEHRQHPVLDFQLHRSQQHEGDGTCQSNLECDRQSHFVARIRRRRPLSYLVDFTVLWRRERKCTSVERNTEMLISWSQELGYPPDWARFNTTIAPCIKILHLDTRPLYDSLLLRQLLDNFGQLRMPSLKVLEVSLHGYDRHQMELALRFTMESVETASFTVYFDVQPWASSPLYWEQ